MRYILEQLKNELMSFGLELEGLPILDGQFHRTKYQGSKDKRGFYTGIIINDVIYSTFGTWDDRGSDKKYCSNSGIKENDNVFNEIIEKRKKEQEQDYKKAAKKAAKILENGGKINEKHPYVLKKKIKPIMPVVDDLNRLIIPVIDAEGKISSIQYISADGDKQFLYNGKIKDCCHIIPGNKTKICICEGWATGCTINQATGFFVVVAFNEGNLENMTKIVKEKYPTSEIILCADNDHKSKRNAGLERGKSIISKYQEVVLRYPSGINGTDFNDLSIEKGLEAVKAIILDEPVICTAQDLITETNNNSTYFPECIYQNKGLISLGLNALSGWSGSEIIQYNLPVVLIHISTAIAGKIRCGNVHPSFLFVKLGHTSTGKSEADKAIIQKLSERMDLKEVKKDSEGKDEIISKIYGANDIASGPGFLRSVQKSPLGLLSLDEIAYLFCRQVSGFDSNSSGKIKEILEISTSPGRQKIRPYADGSKNITIDYPVINLIGNAPIKKIFSSFTLDDLSSGLIPRFEFFCYDGPIPYRNKSDLYNIDGDLFVNRIADLKNHIRPQDEKNVMSYFFKEAVDVGMTYDASILKEKYGRDITDRCNKEDDDGVRGLMSRQFDAIIKFALIHAASTRELTDIYNPIEVVDMEWGKQLSDILTEWKVNILAKNISSGNFDSMCQDFLEAAKSCIKQGKKPSGKIMIHRRPALKNLTPKQWDEVVKVLRARGQIIVKEEKKTLYYPINEKKLDESI